MNIKPQTGRRNYAKGGEVGLPDVEKTQAEMAMEGTGGIPKYGGSKKGGGAYVNPKEYPGWPQMGGVDAYKHFGGGGGGGEE